MKYEWSEDKRLANIEKHGRDFRDAHKVWESGAPTLDKYSERKGDERWQTTGRIDKDRVVVVHQEKSEDVRRIISFRDATTKERAEYEREIERGLGRENDVTRLLDSISRQREEPDRGIKTNPAPTKERENREDRER